MEALQIKGSRMTFTDCDGELMTLECLHVADMDAMNEKDNYMCLANGNSNDD